MSTSPSTGPPLVARLRAAGCVFAEEEAALLITEAASAETLEQMVRRRISGLPLEQVLGWSEFFGLRVPVAPGVFVPRRRTELLAERAVDVISSRDRPAVVELCCGSGAISLAMAAHTTTSPELHAVDIQPASVQRASVTLTGLATVYAGDLFSPLPPALRGRIDAVVANAPYIPTAQLGTMPREARDHEPAITLDGGSDGLDLLRRIIAAAPDWLSPDGCVLLECSEHQSEAVAGIMASADFRPEIVRREETDATVAIGRRGSGTAEAPR
ncbi:putative protein N(5)-glutamine methyltransferase [Arthrobacter sp. zg-Y1219]|uniref:putative protein N(5)-glutamine methyltransferase n=1 Tax=Arthrobacter sp. zg-Y1219 TaxID=3049067 RepID=UPI0024C37D2F|nr:putative protein N(5)-glutamine methyltransferase [Arthrobacter sp. zg-Y1219]MDK1361888.1 putative protein N(5)-glutamine methyltransferase [Arthrobacter sp. zg-Y1219]